MTKAIFPGTFDPITKGHLDIVERGAEIFEHVYVAVYESAEKETLFDKNERVEMFKLSTQHLKKSLQVSILRPTPGSDEFSPLSITKSIFFEVQIFIPFSNLGLVFQNIFGDATLIASSKLIPELIASQAILIL